jgi:hypothetical protein
LVKNPLVLALGIVENGRSWLFLTKMGVVWPFVIDQRCWVYASSPKVFKEEAAFG